MLVVLVGPVVTVKVAVAVEVAVANPHLIHIMESNGIMNMCTVGYSVPSYLS